MDAQQARLKARYLRQQQDAAKLKNYGRVVGLSLGLTAITIYFYSMYMVKQESIIKEIDDEIKRS